MPISKPPISIATRINGKRLAAAHPRDPMLHGALNAERGRLVRSARASRPGTFWTASETLAVCGRDVRAPFSDLLRLLAAAA